MFLWSKTTPGNPSQSSMVTSTYLIEQSVRGGWESLLSDGSDPLWLTSTERQCFSYEFELNPVLKWSLLAEIYTGTLPKQESLFQKILGNRMNCLMLKQLITNERGGGGGGVIVAGAWAQVCEIMH